VCFLSWEVSPDLFVHSWSPAVSPVGIEIPASGSSAACTCGPHSFRTNLTLSRRRLQPLGFPNPNAQNLGLAIVLIVVILFSAAFTFWQELQTGTWSPRMREPDTCEALACTSHPQRITCITAAVLPARDPLCLLLAGHSLCMPDGSPPASNCTLQLHPSLQRARSLASVT